MMMETRTPYEYAPKPKAYTTLCATYDKIEDVVYDLTITTADAVEFPVCQVNQKEYRLASADTATHIVRVYVGRVKPTANAIVQFSTHPVEWHTKSDAVSVGWAVITDATDADGVGDDGQFLMVNSYPEPLPPSTHIHRLILCGDTFYYNHPAELVALTELSEDDIFTVHHFMSTGGGQ